jgi:hypothetical protein
MADIDVTGALKKKIGPLPGYAYVLVIAGAAWAYKLYKGKGQEEPVTTEPGFPGGGGSDVGVGDELGINDSSSTNGSGNLGVNTAPTSNLDWWQKGSTYLIGFGYDGAIVGAALNKYLQGESLSVSEHAMVNQVIARYGQPPEGVPTSPVETPVTPPPGGDQPQTPATPPPAPQQNKYTLPSPMTVKDVCRTVYGYYVWLGLCDRLYYANEGTIVGQARQHGVNKDYADYRLAAGTVLVIP